MLRKLFTASTADIPGKECKYLQGRCEPSLFYEKYPLVLKNKGVSPFPPSGGRRMVVKITNKNAAVTMLSVKMPVRYAPFRFCNFLKTSGTFTPSPAGKPMRSV